MDQDSANESPISYCSDAIQVLLHQNPTHVSNISSDDLFDYLFPSTLEMNEIMQNLKAVQKAPEVVPESAESQDAIVAPKKRAKVSKKK